MEWFWRILACILRMSWVDQFAARAHLAVEAVIFDYQRYPPGSLSENRERLLACWTDRALTHAHTAVEAWIFHRAMDLIGVYPCKHRRVVYHRGCWRAISRREIGRRLRDLCRRLETLEQTARRRAELYRSWHCEISGRALSTRIPREGGGPGSRASANDNQPMISALRALAGSPPARGIRLMDAAPRDGPVLAVTTPKPQQIQPISPQRLAA